MRLHLTTLLCIVTATGCYTSSRAAGDINPAWRGYARVELDAALGRPDVETPQPDGTTLVRWVERDHHLVGLPSAGFSLDVTPTSVDFSAGASSGEVQVVEHEIASAVLDPKGTILAFQSPTLAAGIPDGFNARTGIVFGLHGGIGTLDDASTPMPSVGTYIGGMLTGQLALVGAYTFVNGKKGAGFLQGHSWALAAQYWATTNFNVRAGAAMVLTSDPVELSPGGVLGASYAVIRAGAFVVDLRVDATISTVGAFGMAGAGVNFN